MKLFEIEYHLELARRKRDQYRDTNRHKHLERAILSIDDADALVWKTGCGRHELAIEPLRERILCDSGSTGDAVTK